MTGGQAINLPVTLKDKAHEALISLWWTAVLLRKESKKFFNPYISSEAQFNILMILKYAGQPYSQNDLGQRLLVDKSNITGLVDRLEAAGLIRRNRVEKDRRRYHITLTARGRKLVDRLDCLYKERVKRIMSVLSEKEYDQLIKLTAKVRQSLLASDQTGE